jgi:hypothetical protein
MRISGGLGPLYSGSTRVNAAGYELYISNFIRSKWLAARAKEREGRDHQEAAANCQAWCTAFTTW